MHLNLLSLALAQKREKPYFYYIENKAQAYNSILRILKVSLTKNPVILFLVILGAKNDAKVLKELMDTYRYTQIMQTATFLSAGSLLGHIYINSQVFTVLNNSVVSVYYSDHQAIKLSLIFK